MNGWDILILALVAAMVYFAARAWRRGGRKNSACCGTCDGCASCGQKGKTCPGCAAEKTEPPSV